MVLYTAFSTVHTLSQKPKTCFWYRRLQKFRHGFECLAHWIENSHLSPVVPHSGECNSLVDRFANKRSSKDHRCCCVAVSWITFDDDNDSKHPFVQIFYPESRMIQRFWSFWGFMFVWISLCRHFLLHFELFYCKKFFVPYWKFFAHVFTTPTTTTTTTSKFF